MCKVQSSDRLEKKGLMRDFVIDEIMLFFVFIFLGHKRAEGVSETF